MGANKAPGPDGLTGGFYRTHWDILGPSVTGGRYEQDDDHTHSED
jgi:hypothetical protein